MPSSTGGGLAEGDAGDRRRGVRTDSRAGGASSAAQSGIAPPRVTISRAAACELARAPVVAETGPGGEHLLRVGGGQGAGVGKSRQEAMEKGDRGLDPGLLQHDLGDPDRPGIAGSGARGGRGDSRRTRRGGSGGGQAGQSTWRACVLARISSTRRNGAGAKSTPGRYAVAPKSDRPRETRGRSSKTVSEGFLEGWLEVALPLFQGDLGWVSRGVEIRWISKLLGWIYALGSGTTSLTVKTLS